MKAKELIQQITDQVHKNANVRVVFGEPITKENITIIPVAKVVVKGGGGGGFGGPGGSISMSAGFISQAQSQPQRSCIDEKQAEPTIEEPKASSSDSASDKKSASPGGGMGLGLQVETTPLGYIEIKDGQARYKEIVDAGKLATSGMIFSGIMFFFITRMISLFAKKNLQQQKLKQKSKTA